MRIALVALLFPIVLPLASCVNRGEEDKVVSPPSDSTTIPWSQPRPGQGGGALNALPQQPRR